MAEALKARKLRRDHARMVALFAEANARRHAASLLKRPPRPCATCGGAFTPPPGHLSRRFCSQICAGNGYSRGSRADLFWSRVKKTDSCWLWAGHPTRGGYGRSSYLHKGMHAHRLGWILTNGDVPKGMFVCHHCDNRLCVRPDHLFLGTHSDNMADMARKGRASKRDGERHHMAKLDRNKVLQIKARCASGLSQSAVAREFGVNQSQVSRIVHGRRWNHIPREAPCALVG